MIPAMNGALPVGVEDVDAEGVDVVVIGGGPAGAAAAIELARAGRRVVVLERSTAAQDKVCGDFLSGEAVEDVARLGVDVQGLGGVSIERVSLVGAMGSSSARLPFRAQSVTRRALDEALLGSAASAGAGVRRGHRAQAVERNGGMWRVDVASAEGEYALRAADVMVATGKHDLRGFPRPAGEQSGLVGLKMYLWLAAEQRAALEGGIEIVLLAGGYGGLSLVEDGVANFCFVADREAVRSLGSGWDAVAAMLREHAHLRKRLDGAEALLARPLAISPIPYGFVRREAVARGLWCVGDQAAVIPSFTGDGVALALYSGRRAARVMIDGGEAEAFQTQFCEQVRRQVGRAMLLSKALIVQPQRAVVEMAARVWPGALRVVAARTRLAEGWGASG